MHVNSCGGLPSFPPDVVTDTTPQPVANASVVPSPSLHGLPAPLPLLQEPVPRAPALPASEPVLSPDAHRNALADALRSRDLPLIHRLLAQDVSLDEPCPGLPLLVLAAKFLNDAGLMNILLERAGPGMREDSRLGQTLYDVALNSGNLTALDCLVNWSVPGQERAARQCNEFLRHAACRGKPADLAAAIRLWRRLCPEFRPDVDGLLRSLALGLEADCLRLVLTELQPEADEHLDTIRHLLIDAGTCGRTAFAGVLIQWLGCSAAFSSGQALFADKEIQLLSPAVMCLLASARYPAWRSLLPAIDEPSALHAFRSALHGSDPAATPVGQWMRDASAQPMRIIREIASCEQPARDSDAGRTLTAKALFMLGLSAPVAHELAHLLAGLSVDLPADRADGAFCRSALCNELPGNESLASSEADELRCQLAWIARVSHDLITSLLGQPVVLAAELLGCIGADREVDASKLALFVCSKGLPPVLEHSLALSLKSALERLPARSTGESAAGLGGRESGAGAHQEASVFIFRCLVADIPRRLQSYAMLCASNELVGIGSERVWLHAAISALTQYCTQLAEDPEAADTLLSLLRRA